MKTKMTTFLMAAMAVLFGIKAETVAVNGGDVSYAGASAVKTLDNGDVVLVYTNTAASGSFSIPSNAKARIVVVAGGGAGGSMAAVDEIGEGAAGGGGAGGVSDREATLRPGNYTVTVGEGGKRVQTIVQAWVGANGENSTIEFNGNAIATAKGGGGGGTVKVNGRGESGGSGGGGSWFGNFFPGGSGVGGQGWAGGTAATTDCGAGGGGAALDFKSGNGMADGTPGAGRELDVTGEAVVYARGGRGGVRNADYVPQDGAGFGFGGDGAGLKGRGGAGASGIVIVRIYKLFEYKKVAQPTIESFVWENGKTFTAFNTNNIAEPLASAIEHIDGTTSVKASITGTGANAVTNGLGRFHFSIKLKDEYVWDDGTPEGSTKNLVSYWRVKEPGTIGEATIDVTKTVEWSEGNQATIKINIKAKPEMVAEAPHVLFLASGCGAHGFSSDVYNAAVNAITEIGNVDVFFFNASGNSTTLSPAYSHSYAKGEKVSGKLSFGGKNLDVQSGNHGVLLEFYNQLSEIRKEVAAGKRQDYDYIIFAFDRGLIATKFAGSHADEANVVSYVRKFYDKDRVIWLVDNEEQAVSLVPSGLTQTPWAPSPMAFVSYEGSQQSYWTTLDYYVSKWGADSQKKTPFGFLAYKAMIGLFTPSMYSSVTQKEYGASADQKIDNDAKKNRIKKLTGVALKNQVIYDNAANVAATLETTIKVKPSTIQLNDEIFSDSGLVIDQTRSGGNWTTNEVVQGWTTMTNPELQFTTNTSSIKLEGITSDVEINLSIGIKDTGSFRTSLGAKFNETTGLWEKDPNKGAAVASITPEGEETILADAEATTAVAWSFPTHKVTCRIDHGEGEMVINGFITNEVHVAGGCTPEVVFRGKGGYVLDYLEIDGTEIKDFKEGLYNWIFNEVTGDHEVVAGFKTVFTVPYPTTGPSERLYDGKPAQPTVTMPTFIEGYDYNWKAVYSFEYDGEYSENLGQVNVVYDKDGNVTSTNVFVRIWINQPGFEDGVVIDYWTGENTATVLPREITVKYEDYAQTTATAKTGNFASALIEGTIVAGDRLVLDGGKVLNRPTKKDAAPGTITNNGNVYVLNADNKVSGDYIINVIDGKYYYPDINLVANAVNVYKYYDNKPATTEVTTVHPANAKTTHTEGSWTMYTSKNKTTTREDSAEYRTREVVDNVYSVKYSLDKVTWTDVKPSFTDAGEYTIYYTVDYTVHTYTERNERTGGTLIWGWGSKWSDEVTQTTKSKIDYKQYEGHAKITILPRKVTVVPGSKLWEYDGAVHTDATYTVQPVEPSESAGFLNGEGFASVTMTSGSQIVNPGVVDNVVDAGKVRFLSGTKAANYNVTYVKGSLKVESNPMEVTAKGGEKLYDGQPIEQATFVITDSHGKPMPPGSYTITYKTNPTAAGTTTIPDPPTDSGEYAVFYTVDGGTGYGIVSGVVTFKINPRDVVLVAGSAEKEYDRLPLTTTDFTVEGDGFVAGEGIVSLTMTKESKRTVPGSTKNEIDVYDTENWVMKEGTKVQNYNYSVKPGKLTVTRKTVFEVDGDGEFCWTDGAEDGNDCVVTVVVDGIYTNQIYMGSSEGHDHVIHVLDEKDNDGATHVIEFFYAEDGDDTNVWVDEYFWQPSATEEEMYQAVSTDPKSESLDALKEIVIIENEVEGGWMPYVYTNENNDVKFALRTPDGTQSGANNAPGGGKLDSEFSVNVEGSGEIRVTRISIPVDNDANTDHGKLEITKDGKTYKIPPIPDETISYTIVTNGNEIIISNLVIQVTGDSVDEHDIKFRYTRDADDTSYNTFAVVEDIVWKTYGQTDDGGTSWLDEYKALMIVDHEPLQLGWVYLAFKPNLKVPDEVENWIQRSSDNKKIMVKFGLTREDCDKCEPVVAELSDKKEHPIKKDKVWIRVRLSDLEVASGGTEDMFNQVLGFWRIYIDGSRPGEVTPSPSPVGPMKVMAMAAPASASALDDNAPADESTLDDMTSSEEGAKSVNVFGILKIESKSKNTMIAIPWTWYSELENGAEDIPVKKLVKTTNLTEGDMLYIDVDGGNTYAAWALLDGVWTPGTTVGIDKLGLGRMKVEADEEDDEEDNYKYSTRVARGGSLWVVRSKPVDENGNAIPFWIYGQSVRTPVTTLIPAPTGDQNVVSTMLGNPYAQAIKVNNINFEGTIDSTDKIWFVNAAGTTINLSYLAGKGWRSTSVKRVNGRTTNVYNYEVEIPAGFGFWYDRRGKTPMSVTWEFSGVSR